MKIDQIRILKILEEISHADYTSQRELSKKLNISLGLVNSFIKRLIKKGYFKVSTLPKNRLKYILTPEGVTKKTMLTYEYLQYSLVFYKSTRSKILALFQEIEEQGATNIVFYGAGEISEISYILIQQTNMRLVAIVDPNRSGQKFMGRTVLHPDNLSTLENDKIFITELYGDKSIKQIADECGTQQAKCALIR